MQPNVSSNIATWLATGFGVGRWCPAPGTAGAAMGVILSWLLHWLLPNLAWQALAVMILNAVGVPLATAAGHALGGQVDNQAIIWDEIASMAIVFLFVPLSQWWIGLVGFGLHRLFDITKLPPARQLECLPDGLGVMADDWAAAIYAGIALSAITWGVQQLA
jgi:phosphatidylglycerophosphatase A